MKRIDTGYYESAFRGVLFRVMRSDIAPIKYQWRFQVGNWKQEPGCSSKRKAMEEAKRFINEETYKVK